MTGELNDVERADGESPCPFCGDRPAFGDPWTRVHVGSTVWPRACVDCWLLHDNLTQPPPEGP